MTTLTQDITYALRQLRKTPSFTLTVLLTLALGIGANAAIFTLVHSVLLSSLPVVDPATLIRVGDNNDCCVNGGVPDDGHHTLFATETYNYLRKNISEFEELAAMQSGYEFNSITVRRDSAANIAQSVKESTSPATTSAPSASGQPPDASSPTPTTSRALP